MLILFWCQLANARRQSTWNLKVSVIYFNKSVKLKLYFCFGGKYVALWVPLGVSVAIRLFKASQWECAGAGLRLLPCPPTGSLISPQSGNDPCFRDVAALFKYDARCSPTFSVSSHCPGEARGSTTSHNTRTLSPCCYLVACIFVRNGAASSAQETQGTLTLTCTRNQFR